MTGVFRRPFDYTPLRTARRAAVALAALTVAAAAGAPAIVRSTPKTSDAGVSLSTATFAATPAVGNYIVVLISGWNAGTFGVTSVTDNQGNTYSRAGAQPASSGLCRADIWYAKATTASGTFTVTVNCGSGSYLEWIASEVSGLAATSPADAGAEANSATGDAAVGPTATLAQTSEIVFAVAAVANNDTNITITTPSGYTNLAINQDATATIGMEASYKIVSATTAVSASWTHDNTAQDGWVAKIATFKAA